MGANVSYESLGCCPCTKCKRNEDNPPFNDIIDGVRYNEYKCHRRCYNEVHEGDDDFNYDYTGNCRTKCVPGRGSCKKFVPL